LSDSARAWLRAIFFDLDDTLVDDTISLDRCAEQAAREVAAYLPGASVDLGRAYVHAAMAFWSALGTDAAPRERDIRPAMWRRALQSRGIEDAQLARRLAERFDELRVESAEFFPEAIGVLEQLHGKYRLGIITNGFAQTHDAKIARLELRRFFDHVILAGDLDWVKPDPGVFRHAMQLAGVTPQQSVMVGDRFERDIAGAQDAGMHAIWTNIRAERVPPGAREPDAIIASIGELPRALEALRRKSSLP
jgi:putative hydrolase of the HAD superfamily